MRAGSARLSSDVFEVEPLPADSPLWARDDVYVTPHVAALSRPEDVAKVFAANLDRYFRGEPLLTLRRGGLGEGY